LRTDLCGREFGGGGDKNNSPNMEKWSHKSYNLPTDSLKLLPLLTKCWDAIMKIKKGIFDIGIVS
jgi:hypothetical protein